MWPRIVLSARLQPVYPAQFLCVAAWGEQVKLIIDNFARTTVIYRVVNDLPLDGYIAREEIFPKSVILLDAPEDNLLLERIRDSLTEAEAFGTHYTAADMLRRIAAYRKANNSQVAEPPLKQFFTQ